jgi:dihydroneopterin aldolase / 2-amino-4-hydroxy-6-hydroxymethyldihydropteridine diphosphokinase / dihydropteroate synthase
MDAQGLLGVLKDVEKKVGRTPNISNGPRIVDLDILFDGSRTYYFDDIPGMELQVPHPRVQEREFVLRPLAE